MIDKGEAGDSRLRYCGHVMRETPRRRNLRIKNYIYIKDGEISSNSMHRDSETHADKQNNVTFYEISAVVALSSYFVFLKPNYMQIFRIQNTFCLTVN